MLRRTPSTPLVCLVLFVSLAATNYAAAADPQESLEILLKPNSSAAAAAGPAKARAARSAVAPRPMMPPQAAYAYPPPTGPITKVKPLAAQPYYAYTPPCILPKPMPGQWDMSAEVIIGRTKGTIGYPRVSPWWGGWWGNQNEADLNGDLGLPEHGTMMQFTAKYQFRPSWGLRYTILGNQFNGGGQPSRQFMFGTNWTGGWWITPGLPINTQWQHQYQKVELVYDALKSCSALLSISGGWVHTDDKISLNCQTCGLWTAIFSEGGGSAFIGMDLQRCIRTAPNGGTLSMDCKAGVIFLDDATGWDVEAGLRFSVPLNCGRAGYMKAGYRLINYQKSQTELLFSNTIEGGYVACGFIF